MAEVGTRLANGWNQSWVDCHRFHPQLGWCLREGWHGRWDWTGGECRVNAQGLRADADLRPKAPGERRLLVLGDSVTFGASVTTAETYPAQMQGMLPGWRVLNGGVTGYDPAQEAEWLELFGERLEPDALVIGFCRNDVCPSARLNGLWHTDAAGLGGWLMEHSAAAYKAHRAFWRWRAHRAKEAGEVLPTQAPDAEAVAGWPFIEQNYRRIAARAKAHGWPVAVLVFPPLDYLNGTDLVAVELQYQFQVLGKELGWEIIDLTPAFRPDPQGLFLPNDNVHPTAEGYRRAAAVAVRELVTRNVLPGPAEKSALSRK